jgi:hypothetical protein
MERSQWPPSLLRSLWQSLMDVSEGRKLSGAHETAWLNLCGYCLRPGYGIAVDDWRVSEVWRSIHGKLAFGAAGSRTESLILWRRIAGGMTAGQQQQLITPLIGPLTAKTTGAKAVRFQPHEIAELWRLVGSLERIPAAEKEALAQAAISSVDNKKSEPFRDAILWAVGRLASRSPVYGPLNTVIAAPQITSLLKAMIRPPTAEPMRMLAVMQIAQRTDDRYRDIDGGLRGEVVRWLIDNEAPQRMITAVESGGGTSAEDAAAIFGESLPLGIRLKAFDP